MGLFPDPDRAELTGIHHSLEELHQRLDAVGWDEALKAEAREHLTAAAGALYQMRLEVGALPKDGYP